jgi:glycosyltransferase involved in cell wall biosynthesis
MNDPDTQTDISSDTGNPQENRRFIWMPTEPTPYTLALAKALRERSPWRIQALFIEENHSQPWHLKLDPAWSRVLPGSRLAATTQILAELRAGGVVGVMVDGWSGMLALVTFIACHLRRIPISLTSDTQLYPRRPFWKRLAKALWYPFLFRLPDLFFVAGKRQAAMVRRYGVPDARINVFGLTVDVETIRKRIRELRPQREALRARFGLEAGATVVLYVGRLWEYKGIMDLLDGFQATTTICPSSRLLVVGSGSLEEQVAQRARRDSRIRFVGRLDFDGVMEALSLADVAVVPSRSEAWGLVVIESMAAGLPVVVTHQVGCLDDLIREGDNGLVVPDRDPTALRHALESLLCDPERLQRMRRQSQVGLDEWTIERSAERIVAGWRAMVAAREK